MTIVYMQSFFRGGNVNNTFFGVQFCTVEGVGQGRPRKNPTCGGRRSTEVRRDLPTQGL